MINQQVNLFQPIFRKERKLLSFRVLVQASGMVAATLLLLYAYGAWQTRAMRADLAQLQNQMTQRTARLTQLGNELAQARPESGPQQEFAHLEREMLARRKVVDTLTQVRETYTEGVSGYMESFARQSPQGLWLTGFSVQAGGEGLVIRGSAVKPELVPSFIQKLASEETLAGTRFGLLQIQREDKKEKVDFTLYTGTEPPPEETAP